MGCHRKLPDHLCIWVLRHTATSWRLRSITQHLRMVPSSSDLPGSLAFTLKRRQFDSVRFPPGNWKPCWGRFSTSYLRVLQQTLGPIQTWLPVAQHICPSAARIKVVFSQTYDLSYIWDSGKKWSVLCYLTEVMCAHSCHSSAKSWLISHFQVGIALKEKETHPSKVARYFPHNQDCTCLHRPAQTAPMVMAFLPSLRSPELRPDGISSTALCRLFVCDNSFRFLSLPTEHHFRT